MGIIICDWYLFKERVGDASVVYVLCIIVANCCCCCGSSVDICFQWATVSKLLKCQRKLVLLSPWGRKGTTPISEQQIKV